MNKWKVVIVNPTQPKETGQELKPFFTYEDAEYWVERIEKIDKEIRVEVIFKRHSAY